MWGGRKPDLLDGHCRFSLSRRSVRCLGLFLRDESYVAPQQHSSVLTEDCRRLLGHATTTASRARSFEGIALAKLDIEFAVPSTWCHAYGSL